MKKGAENKIIIYCHVRWVLLYFFHNSFLQAMISSRYPTYLASGMVQAENICCYKKLLFSTDLCLVLPIYGNKRTPNWYLQRA